MVKNITTVMKSGFAQTGVLDFGPFRSAPARR